MELKKYDTKLLAYLYHNNRDSLTNIAKGVHLSREQVDYKISKFIESGIIKKFIPIVNYSKLGYKHFIILLLRFNKPNQMQIFLEEHKKDRNWISRGKVLAKYDMFMHLLFNDEKERNEYLSDMLQTHNEYIADCLILSPYFGALYPIKFLGSNKGGDYILTEYGQGVVELDEKDKSILKALAKDARAKIIDIAKEIGISAELVLYRLRKLKKEGILLGSRIQFDMDKLGYFYASLLINIKNFSLKNQNKLKTFAKNAPYVTSIAFMVNKPNCFISLFYKNENELRKTIEELKKLFNGDSIEMDIFFVKSEEEEINTLPFLD
ncbi:Lrp/AsnC family transcriptional regulator [Candidatus Woesearchaeota archaeon]|nr:Lrp/AsnC family transcriptional regulator [Candidatus Woesearchaeota archaeon]